jgi:hypothetical protein
MVTKRYQNTGVQVSVNASSSAQRRNNTSFRPEYPSLTIEVFDDEIDVYNYELLDVDSVSSDETLTVEEDQACRIESDGLPVNGVLEVHGELVKTGEGDITGSGEVRGSGTIYVIDDYFYDGE